MKILHAIYSFNTGGAETMLVDIINQQCKTESVNLLIVNNKFNTSLLETIDKRVNVFLIGRKEGNKLQLLTAFGKINAILHKIHPDVIHCHDNNLLPFFIRWKKKNCLTVHNVQLPTAFVRNYRQVFAVSTAVQEDIKKRTGIKAKIIYNGIELAEYHDRKNKKFNSMQEPFKIVQISRLFPAQKGQRIAIQSIQLLKKRYPEIRFQLDFVGDGDALAELQALAIRYDIQDRITFVGQVDRNWVKTHLQNYHALIQPSLFEGFGLTVIEGLACGLPVIASDLDGPKEIVQLLSAGLLVQPNNAIDLAEKIYQVYQCYLADTVCNSAYVVRDKQQLAVFDIRNTAKVYLENYSMDS